MRTGQSLTDVAQHTLSMRQACASSGCFGAQALGSALSQCSSGNDTGICMYGDAGLLQLQHKMQLQLGPHESKYSAFTVQYATVRKRMCVGQQNTCAKQARMSIGCMGTDVFMMHLG